MRRGPRWAPCIIGAVRRFAHLYEQLDASTATTDKVAALRRYYAEAPSADAAWATYFLAGGKPRQVVPTALLRALACRRAGIDDWLFDECYQAVGDLAETIANVLPPGSARSDDGLADWIEQRLLPLRTLSPDEQAERVLAAWDELDAAGRFLFIKLIGGGFRVGVSKLLVQRALGEHAGLDAKQIAQRMMGWTDARATPSAARFEALLSAASSCSKRAALGVARASVQPIRRWASSLPSSPACSASARCTSSRLTPTRKPPPMSLTNKKRPPASSSSQACRTRAL